MKQTCESIHPLRTEAESISRTRRIPVHLSAFAAGCGVLLAASQVHAEALTPRTNPAAAMTFMTLLEETRQDEGSLVERVNALHSHFERMKSAVRGYVNSLSNNPAELTDGNANETLKAAFQLNERLLARSLNTRSRISSYRSGLRSTRNLDDADAEALEKLADELLEKTNTVRDAMLAEHEFLRRYYLHVAKWQRTYQAYRNLSGDSQASQALTKVIRETLPENQPQDTAFDETPDAD